MAGETVVCGMCWRPLDEKHGPNPGDCLRDITKAGDYPVLLKMDASAAELAKKES